MSSTAHSIFGASPHQAAIIDGDTTWTYANLAAAVAHTAAHLHEHGVVAGERVGVLLPPDRHTLVLILALLRQRAVAALLNTALPPAAIQAQLQQIQSSNLITSTPMHLDQIRVFDRSIFNLQSSIFQPSSLPTFQLTNDQPATIMWTSGSVGRPKAVLHTWGNHYFNALGSAANIPFGPGNRWLLGLPLFHVSGLSILVRTVVGGATVVIPAQRNELAPTMMEHGVTHVSLVSTQLIRLLDDEQGRRALRQLKAILLGGSAMPRAALAEAYALGLPVHISYGLTEMGSQVATTPRDVPVDKRYTSGRVLPHRELSIDSSGQILVRGPTRFAGYVEGSELRQPFDADGWYATGDLGFLDDEGYLHVQGRKDNMFIAGGENIQPEEIEAVLLQLSGVEQAMVVPVPDAKLGFRPVAFVKTHDVAHEEIVAFLADRLPRFKLPRTFLPWPEQSAASGIKVSRTQMQRAGLEHVAQTGTLEGQMPS